MNKCIKIWKSVSGANMAFKVPSIWQADLEMRIVFKKLNLNKIYFKEGYYHSEMLAWEFFRSGMAHPDYQWVLTALNKIKIG